jgi:hypothetical protein
MSVIPKPIEIWRSRKQSETRALFPFLQGPSRWRRWLGLARLPQHGDPALRVHHALAPFRQRGEVDGAAAVIVAAARRNPRLDPTAIERLLVDLRYCADPERFAAYGDPDAWLDARAGRAPRPVPRPLGFVRVR